MDARTAFLTRIARQSKEGCEGLAERAFAGGITVETANTVYRFVDGEFVSRTRNGTTEAEVPRAMRGSRLVGFLEQDGAQYDLTRVWRPGTAAVLWKPAMIGEGTFLFTSTTVSVTHAEPEPSPWLARTGSVAQKPKVATHRPVPASMTRIHLELSSLVPTS